MGKKVKITVPKCPLSVRDSSPQGVGDVKGEGWPLLTVETVENGDSKNTNMNGVLPWLVCWARCAGTRDVWPASAALVSPVQNFFSSQDTISVHSSRRPF
jgi:hypothetical protein